MVSVSIARGETEAGVLALEATLAGLPEGAFFAHYAGIHATLAEALGRMGATARGLAVIDQVIAWSERNDEAWYLAEFLRVRGGLLRREGATAALDNAEALYLQAIDQARRQDALSWELRASTDLAQLYEDQGRAGAARSTVAPVYARFTQGFETADLKAARTLLERLR